MCTDGLVNPCPSVHITGDMSISLSIGLSVCLYICMAVHSYICMSVGMFVCNSLARNTRCCRLSYRLDNLHWMYAETCQLMMMLEVL